MSRLNRPTTYRYDVIHEYPHDPTAFTQGLVFSDGWLFESTGGYGSSMIRKVRLETGQIVAQRELGANFFGEGLTYWHNWLIQLTWQSETAFVYDRHSLELITSFGYSGEGWGLTQDTTQLILTDGETPRLRFFDPATFTETGAVEVNDGNMSLKYLNELEYINGQVFANVWPTDRIAVISPLTGNVRAWIDLTGLLSPSQVTHREAVLNGIAYDEITGRMFVTGKYWPKLFELKLIESS